MRALIMAAVIVMGLRWLWRFRPGTGNTIRWRIRKTQTLKEKIVTLWLVSVVLLSIYVMTKR